jgi:hypothetical protein
MSPEPTDHEQPKSPRIKSVAVKHSAAAVGYTTQILGQEYNVYMLSDNPNFIYAECKSVDELGPAKLGATTRFRVSLKDVEHPSITRAPRRMDRDNPLPEEVISALERELPQRKLKAFIRSWEEDYGPLPSEAESRDDSPPAEHRDRLRGRAGAPPRGEDGEHRLPRSGQRNPRK